MLYYTILGLKILLAFMFIHQGYRKLFNKKERVFWQINNNYLTLLGILELVGAVLLFIIPNPLYVAVFALLLVLIATFHFIRKKKKKQTFLMPLFASSILILIIILSSIYY